MPELSTATTPNSPLPGRSVLAGKYALEALLAEGGMGLVYRGRHVELDQPVAIKIVRPELSLDEEAVARFLNEARAVAKLRSPYVARVLDSGRAENGAPYMVLEFLEGRDLRKLLDDGSGPSVDRAIEIVLHVCEALAEAHAAGIVHRDIKPDNLFIARLPGGASVVKVLDFGICKRLRGATTRSYTGRGRALGSPLYMAPEQITTPERIDARVDVWSLGVVLFELLTGHPPFTGKNVSAICRRVVHGKPDPLRRYRPDLPTALEAVIDRCLEKDPENRPASVAELASALARFVENGREAATRAQLIATGIDLRVETPPRSLPLDVRVPELSRLRRRRWLRTGGLALLVGAALGVLAVGSGVIGLPTEPAFEASVPYVHERPIPAPVPAPAPAPALDGAPARAPFRPAPRTSGGITRADVGKKWRAEPRVLPAGDSASRAYGRPKRATAHSGTRTESRAARPVGKTRTRAGSVFPAKAPAASAIDELMAPYEDLRAP